jgi:hypothetical protein
MVFNSATSAIANRKRSSVTGHTRSVRRAEEQKENRPETNTIFETDFPPPEEYAAAVVGLVSISGTPSRTTAPHTRTKPDHTTPTSRSRRRSRSSEVGLGLHALGSSSKRLGTSSRSRAAKTNNVAQSAQTNVSHTTPANVSKRSQRSASSTAAFVTPDIYRREFKSTPRRRSTTTAITPEVTLLETLLKQCRGMHFSTTTLSVLLTNALL